jgi:hypothetical protein
MMYRVRTQSFSLAGTIVSLLVFAAVLVILYYLFKMFYWLAALAMPVLLIATLLINYRVITRFFLMLWSLIKSRPVLGVLAAIFLFYCPGGCSYFICSGIVFKKSCPCAAAYGKKKIYGEWADFEIIEDDISSKMLSKRKKLSAF